MTSLLTTAASMFNALFPVFAIGIGIALGVGLLAKVSGEIRKAF
jgi:hypothetical protein